MFLFARANAVFAIPFMSKATPDKVATIQKDITGSPSIIINPTKNKINAAKPLQASELNIVRTLLMKAADEILSNRKKIPLNAMSQSKLTFGTIKKSIPITNMKAPKKIDHIIFDK